MERALMRDFENRMIEHLKEFAPKHTGLLPEEDLRKIIHLSWEKAKRYDLVSERSVRIYVQLVLMLGYDFDSDPQFPWAGELLSDSSIDNEVERADRLHDKAWEYFEHSAPDFGNTEGDFNSSRFVELIRQVRQERNDILQPSALPEFQNRMTTQLRKTFPKKCEYIGESGLGQTIQHSIESAKKHGISTERGNVLFIGLAFILGSGFDTDPRLPWVSVSLNDSKSFDQNERVNRLLAETVNFLKRWWAYNQ